jgi:hypothetical protein
MSVGFSKKAQNMTVMDYVIKVKLDEEKNA